jgi:hypothetical protein
MEQPGSSGYACTCETETYATCRSHEHSLGQIDGNGRRFQQLSPYRDAAMETILRLDAVTRVAEASARWLRREATIPSTYWNRDI